MADNVKTVLIIDDKKEEITGLKEILFQKGIYSSFYTPEEINEIQNNLKNHQIIFMDFSLDDTKTNPTDNIALIRKALKKICKENFGSYGLVLWTKHMEYIQYFKNKLSTDAAKKDYITPLFVIGLDKSSYLQNGYESLWQDLNTKLLEDKAALFFFNWRHSVDAASDKALNYMYQLVPDYEKQSEQFPYLLYQMAGNYSGIPTKDMQVYDGMYKDAYRAFDELLYSDLISQQCGFDNIFPKQINKPDYTFEQELEQIAKLNSKLLFDLSFTDQNLVMPGNVYHVLNNNDFLKIDMLNENSLFIAIEMTPPCDFSNEKFASRRLIGGCITDCPKEKKELKKFINSYKAENKYPVWPVEYEGNLKLICFDFRNIYIENDDAIRNASSYKLLFMAKHHLFADILQKFSSHAARLGLSIMKPDLK